MGISRRWVAVLVAGIVLAGACGDDDDLSAGDDSTGGSPPAGDVAVGDGGDDETFRLGQAGWENACTVLSEGEVADATGFTVLGGTEAAGCEWEIEQVDDDIAPGAPSVIGWQPMITDQYDAQEEAAPQASSDIVIEPIDDLGVAAFWLGFESNALGEVWVKLDDLAFRVTNQFAGGGYDGDVRTPMEDLARALVASISGGDVLADSGDRGDALSGPDGIEIPEGLEVVDELIDDLSDIPLPDDAVLTEGSVLGGRAVQDVYSVLEVGDAARFYLEELPSAGFEISEQSPVASEDDVLEANSNHIEFEDPEGRRGQILIDPGVFSAAQIHIEIFLE